MRKFSFYLLFCFAFLGSLSGQTITEIVVASEDHNTLETAVITAGLDDDLSAAGTFTLFAPTDAAFAALPDGTLDALLADSATLADILLYHVAGVEAFAADLANDQKIITLNGSDVRILRTSAGVFVNDARVTMADIDASNGVVHVIDVVLTRPAGSVFEVIADHPDLNTLEAAVNTANLTATLSGGGPLTVFAPTDAAFANLPVGVVDALLANIPALTRLLNFHVVNDELFTDELTDDLRITSAGGNELRILTNPEGVFVEQAMITIANIRADNGVVHIIDAVLMPPAGTVMEIVEDQSELSTLESALTTAGLVETLNGEGPFTIFAPSNAAFDALPAGTLDALLADSTALANLLLYHVLGEEAASDQLPDDSRIVTLNGSNVRVRFTDLGVFVNDAMFTMIDIQAENGVVHIIDAVLTLPPATVVDIIVNSPDHDTLEAAVIAAGLVETLSGDGPFTVFAPTDAAFAALPAGTVEALLADVPTLNNILSYHVIGSENYSDELEDESMLTTLNGVNIRVRINDEGTFINNAKITVADIDADNGVVHVIDAVLTPPAATVADIIVNNVVLTTLERALDAASLTETLRSDGPFTVFAPTDAAFDALPDGVLDALLADVPALTDLLTYHMLNGETLAAGLNDGDRLRTVSGDSLDIRIEGENIFVNNAQIIFSDLTAGNGVVHLIDAILAPVTVEPINTVVDVIVNSEVHTTLEAAVIAADLVETLSGDGPFTVFAPTDDAFAALPAGTLDALLADSATLAGILTYHVVGGELTSDELNDGDRLVSVNGRQIRVSVTDDGIFVDGTQITVADIPADNGVVHVIDAVLMPRAATVVDIIVNSMDHDTLEAAVIAADLVETLSGDGPFTVFAPTDAAFAALPAGTLDALLADSATLAGILTYHVVGDELTSDELNDGDMLTTVNGEQLRINVTDDGIFVNDVRITVADLSADNGVVHVIDAVLMPPPVDPMTTTVVDVIVDSEIHTTLETAVIAADLVETLSGDGPFTVFAPTDAAFAALPAGTLDALLADVPTLRDILTYHVVGGETTSDELNNGDLFTTVNGSQVRISVTAEGIFINDARITVADIEADNGVVHVIDAVLTRPAQTVVDVIVNSMDHNTLESAVIAAGLVDDLSGDGPFTVFAPTDAAFAALPDGQLDELLADPTGALADILRFHVLGTAAYSSDITNGLSVASLEGENLDFSITADGIFVEDAQIVVTDILADNGVVHVIDAVMIPRSVGTAEPAFASEVRIMPNPASSFSTVELPASITNTAKLALRDMTGRLIFTRIADGVRNELSLGNLPNGTYLLEISAAAGRIQRRIVVQH